MNVYALALILATFPLAAKSAEESASDLALMTPMAQSVQTFQKRYALSDVYKKAVDNHGAGKRELYGVRNFRSVLNGFVFRGGANNKYNKQQPRDNNYPLPDVGLFNLCAEGFGQAIYLYSTNFESAPSAVVCFDRKGHVNELTYRSIEPLASREDAHKILKVIYDSISRDEHRPIYLHCWNGWHASGYISAISLRQFCGWSGRQAVQYWKRNTDGNDSGYRRILRLIYHFQPDPEMKLSERARQLLCPTAPPENLPPPLIFRDLTHLGDPVAK